MSFFPNLKITKIFHVVIKISFASFLLVTSCQLLATCFQRRNHCCRMFIWLDPVQNGGNLSFRANHKGRAVNTHILLAIHAFFLHYAVLIANSFVHIGQQRIRQIVFFLEFLLGRGFIGRDAKDNRTGLLDFLECVAEPARLNGSTGRIGFGVEEQDHIFAAIIL